MGSGQTKPAKPPKLEPVVPTGLVHRAAMLTFDENGKTPNAVYRDEHAEFM